MATWDDEVVTWDDAEVTWDDSAPATHHVRVFVADVDVTGNVLSNSRVVIRHGRPNSTVQPDPNTCVFSMTAADASAVPTVGQSVSVLVDIATGGIYRPQFTGFITDVAAALAADGRTVAQIVAVSSGLGRMGRLRVGATPWPVQLDGARITDILAACAAGGVVAGTIDPGTVEFMPLDIDRQNPLDIAIKTAAEALGMLVDGRDGTVSYHDAQHRDPATDPMTDLDASEIRTLPVASQHVGSVINRATIGYGEPVAYVISEDADSIAKYGPMDVSADTQLFTDFAAQGTADAIVKLFAIPRFSTDSLSIPMHNLSQTRTAAIGALEPASLLRVNNLPAPMPAGWLTWVEGIEDSYSYSEWDRTLNVSDRWMVPETENPGYTFEIKPFEQMVSQAYADIMPIGWTSPTMYFDETTGEAVLQSAGGLIRDGSPNFLFMRWPGNPSYHQASQMDAWVTHSIQYDTKPELSGNIELISGGVWTVAWVPDGGNLQDVTDYYGTWDPTYTYPWGYDFSGYGAPRYWLDPGQWWLVFGLTVNSGANTTIPPFELRFKGFHAGYI